VSGSAGPWDEDPSDGRGRTHPQAPNAPATPEETAERLYADRRARRVPGASAIPRGAWFRSVTDLARDGGEAPLRAALVGLMGSGKSTVGAALAGDLGATHVDLDAEIEAGSGLPVARIFQEHGEPVFRALESRAFMDVLDTTRRVVISLGGGAVLSRGVRERITRDAGFAVAWLEVPPRALVERLGEGDAVRARPLLAGLDAMGREAALDRLLHERAPLYEEVATVVVDASTRGAAEVAEEVARRVRARRVERVSLPAESDAERSSERSHDVVVEAGALSRLGRILRRAGVEAKRIALVSDETVSALLGDGAEASLRAAGYDVARIVAPSGERAKEIASLARLWEALADARIDRGGAVIALGGGALTDAVGFAAATWLRGIAWVAVPTTLLGMVDAAVGGKTAIDLGARKNMVGAFHQPRLVVADTDALATLPDGEALSGLGEVWKYALTCAPGLSEVIEARLAPLVARAGVGAALAASREMAVDVVARCVAAKARVVEADERETRGLRKVLNFGHTLGHALESAAGLRLPHGACVAYGMRAAMHLSRAKGLLSAKDAARARALLDLLPLPPIPRGVGDTAIIDALASDKKFKDGKMLFVLLEGIGRPRVDVEVGAEDLPGAIDAMRGRKRVPARGKGP